MESPPQRHIFRLHWRSFLPLWLLPVPATAVILFAHFAPVGTAQRIVPYLFAAMIIYLVVTQLRPLALWRRGQITYWEMQLTGSASHGLCYRPADLPAQVAPHSACS